MNNQGNDIINSFGQNQPMNPNQQMNPYMGNGQDMQVNPNRQMNPYIGNGQNMQMNQDQLMNPYIGNGQNMQMNQDQQMNPYMGNGQDMQVNPNQQMNLYMGNGQNQSMNPNQQVNPYMQGNPNQQVNPYMQGNPYTQGNPYFQENPYLNAKPEKQSFFSKNRKKIIISALLAVFVLVVGLSYYLSHHKVKSEQEKALNAYFAAMERCDYEYMMSHSFVSDKVRRKNNLYRTYDKYPGRSVTEVFPIGMANRLNQNKYIEKAYDIEDYKEVLKNPELFCEKLDLDVKYDIIRIGSLNDIKSVSVKGSQRMSTKQNIFENEVENLNNYEIDIDPSDIYVVEMHVEWSYNGNKYGNVISEEKKFKTSSKAVMPYETVQEYNESADENNSVVIVYKYNKKWYVDYLSLRLISPERGTYSIEWK
ncbi:hypothetical protein SAMN05660484_01990 [Eubacterium ruminantium]|uniref:hypothetical protein n=1 Tax=Eubacterium ruminantium TaxID=42322 RepID=UPI000871ACEE|nr:hypothetical protein [Eubacterium ruminantium]SCW59935.1 hypothetical protein SAMN05660484_01990 [Eubacterium ruminantium]